MIYIETDSALKQACDHWITVSRIALDSEFMRVDTFFPKLALIQINDGTQTYLIDPIKIEDWEPLKVVFTASSVVKVLHSPSEDFDAFYHNLGVLPSPILDSQLAASLASMGGIMGYQKLVKALVDIDLDKGETRSDWMKRPLAESQIHYAAEDVNHLLKMMDQLEQKLNALGRWQWLVDDCASMVADWLENQKHGYGLERIKKGWMLKPHQLNVLNQLVIWREARCREVNKPRGHLINDALLLEVSTRLPQGVHQLGAIKGIRQATIRKEGEQIIKLVMVSKELPKEHWPAKLDRPLNQNAGDWFKSMRALVGSKAEALNVPPEMLARKKPLEAMLRAGYPTGPFNLPVSLQGWREEVISNSLLNLLNKLAGR
jgi:ribonuclease D